MHLNAPQLLRYRVLFVAIIRVMAMAAMCLAVIPISSWLAEGCRDDDLWEMDFYIGRVVSGAFMVVMGLAVFVFAPGLSRLVVRSPRGAACPGCRYDLTGHSSDRCPECGLPLTESGAIPALEPAMAWRERRVALIAASIRLLGILGSVALLLLAMITFGLLWVVEEYWSLTAAIALLGPVPLLLVVYGAADPLARLALRPPGGAGNQEADPMDSGGG